MDAATAGISDRELGLAIPVKISNGAEEGALAGPLTPETAASALAGLALFLYASLSLELPYAEAGALWELGEDAEPGAGEQD